MRSQPHTTRERPRQQTTAVALAALSIVAAASVLASAQAARTVQDGVFTEAQAARGQSVYAQRCASCHGAALTGSQGPPLAGEAFVSRWRSEPLSSLFVTIRNTMPLDAPGDLTPQQSADVLAHILKTSGFPAGKSDLAVADLTTPRIGWPAARATAAAAPGGPAKVFPPVGNVAQLMRGIFFPNSYLIFTVQTHDPAAPLPKPSPDAPAGGFSWVDWGAGIYSGWQIIDNAAIAIADVSPLMLTPGLRCENGRPAPINDPDWIKFTEQMIAVAKQTYRVAQTRNQEMVSDATGDLSDACAACHQVYRDVRAAGRTPNANELTNNSARCTHR